MCVTSGPAVIHGTRTYVHATQLDGTPVHVSGYQNVNKSLAGPNCMFLNFAGQNLKFVRGPELTRSFMDDMTQDLPELVYTPRMRGMSDGGPMSFSMGVTVEVYGDYTGIRTDGPADILAALDQVQPDRRPPRTALLEEMIAFYMAFTPHDSFVLACYNGTVKPKHPIVVSYEPHDPNVLTIPGLDAHDGRPPTPGELVSRDFRVAFGIAGTKLPHFTYYDDNVGGYSWAPSSVAGFRDNRPQGPNGDYVVTFEDVRRGLTGSELAATLR